VHAALLEGHESKVTVVRGVYTDTKRKTSEFSPRTLIATASVDSSLKLWERKENEGIVQFIEINEELNTHLGLCLQNIIQC